MSVLSFYIVTFIGGIVTAVLGDFFCVAMYTAFIAAAASLDALVSMNTVKSVLSISVSGVACLLSLMLLLIN